jgi:glyoxylase-like metal-dependent hydrolase (beta-lactamase superfamily II)
MTESHSHSWFTVGQLDVDLYGIGEFGHYEEVTSFLLVGDERCILIDTGMGFYPLRPVVEQITKLPCQVVNTHSHFDHVGGNYEFERVAIYDHLDCRRAAKEGFSNSFVARWAVHSQFYLPVPPRASHYAIAPFPHATFFTTCDTFNVAPVLLEVIHTPGHSDDSVCLFDSKRGRLFSGDLLYDGPIYIEQKGGLGKFRASVERVASLPNLTRIFCSHNYFEFPLQKLKKLRRTLNAIKTTELEQEVLVEGRLRLVAYGGD